MVLEIFIKYSFLTYSQTFSQYLYFLVDKYIFSFCIHKLFFYFYTVYRVVDKFIPQGIDFVDNFLKFIAIAAFFDIIVVFSL